MDSAFVAWLIEDDLLTEVRADSVRAGDIAIYRNSSLITHGALVVSVDQPMVLHSKWGGNEIHQHGLWELMASYGDEVCFFRPLDHGLILTRLRAYVGTEPES